jgi:hypothetical protein
MKLEQFTIGMEFQTNTGQRWRCTDIGTRTILAIYLDPNQSADWLKGPPYVVPEIVFNEKAIWLAYRSVETMLDDGERFFTERAHPGFPGNVMEALMKGRSFAREIGYPHMDMFRIDRVFMDEKILHPYSAWRLNDEWIIKVYDLFAKTFGELVESEFIKLPYATDADLQKQKDIFTSTGIVSIP